MIYRYWLLRSEQKLMHPDRVDGLKQVGRSFSNIHKNLEVKKQSQLKLGFKTYIFFQRLK
jgi:hypothetical protein